MEEFTLKKNNKGMSLVELIVVVLILGIVSVVGVIGVSNMHQMDATQVTGTIEALMDRTRILSITQDADIKKEDGTDDTENSVSIVLRIKKEDNQYYGIILRKKGTTETELDKVEIGDKTIKLSYNSTEITTGNDFTFNKSDGSFSGTNEGDKIVVKTVKKTKQVYLVKTTGRCYVE